MKTNEEMLKTKWLFKTAKELAEFVKGFGEQQGKILDANYFKLVAVLGTKQNRKLENESDKYIDRDIGSWDALTDMKKAEQKHSRSDTAWMSKIPIITNEKGD